MKIEDLKYITPLDIQAAHLNITSAEMYEEAKNFNQFMYDMQRKRWRFLRDYWAMIMLNILMLIIGCATSLSSYTSLLFLATGGRGPLGMAVGGNMYVTLAPAVIYVILFVWLIMLKKIYNWRLAVVMTAILIPVNYCFAALTIANAILFRVMYRTDEEIKDEPGYPGFAELTLSFIRDEENAEDKGMDSFADGKKVDDLESERKENPFNKYRTRYQAEGGSLLKDNDISNVINGND